MSGLMRGSLVATIVRQAQPSARRFLPGLIFGALSAGAAVSLLAVSGWLIVSASLVDSLVPLSLAIVGVRFFAVSRGVFRYLERLAGHDAALRQLAEARTDLVRRLIPLSPAGLGRADRGAMLSALVDDIDNLQNFPLRVVQPLLVSALVVLGALTFLFVVAPAAALTLALCVVVAAIVAIGLGWWAGAKAEDAVSLKRAELSALIVDYLARLDVLHAYGAEVAARERITEADRGLRAVVGRSAIAQGVAAGVVSVMAGLASVWAVAGMQPAIATGDVDAPWLAVAVLIPLVVFEVFGAVPVAAASWRSVRASAQHLADVVPAVLPEALRSDEGEPFVASGVPALELRDVSARWPGQSEPALVGVNLTLSPGERVLLSGPSGAGKSTVAAVLAGFLRAEGTVTLEGRDVQSMSGPALRTAIGVCEQTPRLFDEDIRQNLLFAKDTASDEELLAVLDRVGLAAWVQERGGLDARVGERGALVSGGQAQRISLARLLLRGFPVLVLDEPTAGVDPQAADALLADLLSATENQSVLLISHVDPPAGLIDRTVRLRAGTTKARNSAELGGDTPG